MRKHVPLYIMTVYQGGVHCLSGKGLTGLPPTEKALESFNTSKTVDNDVSSTSGPVSARTLIP